MTSFWISHILAFLLIAVCWRRDIRWIACLLLIFPTIYFLPSIEVLFDGSSIGSITDLHFRSSSLVMKMEAFVAVGLACVMLYREGRVRLDKHKTTGGLIGLLILGLILDDNFAGIHQCINMVSLILMLFFICWGADAWERCPPKVLKNRAFLTLLIFLLVLLIASVLLAFWEIWNDKAWARFIGSNGYIIQRASAMLFNPNLYGLWCSVLAIIYSLLWQTRTWPHQKNWLLLGVAFAGLGIFLSSSRSSGYLLLVFLFSTAALLTTLADRRPWVPLLVYLSTLFLSTAASIAAWNLGNHNGPEGRFGVLAERFLEAPVQLALICLNSLNSILTTLGLPQVSASVKPYIETQIAFEGRFQGEMRDSGWLVAYDDAGLLGFLALVIFWIGLTSFAMRCILQKRDVYTVYALCLVGYGITVGVFMRYQVFPVGVFIAVLLAPCLALWRIRLSTSKGLEGVWL